MSRGREPQISLKQLNESDLKWLGPFLDINGSVTFNISYVNGHNYASPHISYSNVVGSSNPQYLKDHIGGETYKNGNLWRIVGPSAAILSRGISPYSPSLRNRLQAIQDWENTRGREERVKIAGRANQSPARDVTLLADYLQLVSDPDHLSGYFDDHGSIFDETREYIDADGERRLYFYRSLNFNSTNIGLIQALNRLHKGRVDEDQRCWRLSKQSDLLSFLGTIRGGLRFRRQEIEEEIVELKSALV